MTPNAIYILRHAESGADADEVSGAPLPDHAIPLTGAGGEQARATGGWLASRCQSPVWVWSSTHLRALQTLDELQAGGLSPAAVRQTPLLREQELSGAIDSDAHLSQRDALRAAVGKFHLRLPGGESRADVWLRVSQWMDDLWRSFRDPARRIGSVVVVTHGVTMIVLRARWMHWQLDRLEAEPKPPNCGVYLLDRAGEDGGWRDRGQVYAPS